MFRPFNVVLGVSVVDANDVADYAQRAGQPYGRIDTWPAQRFVRAPKAWKSPIAGFGEVAEWDPWPAQPTTWPLAVLRPAAPTESRAVLVRGVPFWELVPGPNGDVFVDPSQRLGVLSDPAQLWRLCGRAGEGWAVFLAAPDFWARWVAYEAARLVAPSARPAAGSRPISPDARGGRRA